MELFFTGNILLTWTGGWPPFRGWMSCWLGCDKWSYSHSPCKLHTRQCNSSSPFGYPQVLKKKKPNILRIKMNTYIIQTYEVSSNKPWCCVPRMVQVSQFVFQNFSANGSHVVTNSSILFPSIHIIMFTNFVSPTSMHKYFNQHTMIFITLSTSKEVVSVDVTHNVVRWVVHNYHWMLVITRQSHYANLHALCLHSIKQINITWFIYSFNYLSTYQYLIGVQKYFKYTMTVSNAWRKQDIRKHNH